MVEVESRLFMLVPLKLEAPPFRAGVIHPKENYHEKATFYRIAACFNILIRRNCLLDWAAGTGADCKLPVGMELPIPGERAVFLGDIYNVMPVEH